MWCNASNVLLGAMNQDRRGLSWICVLLLVAMVSLQGCTHPPADPTVDENALTPTTDARKRAQIRLELAASYLQLGKADVALEEVQQALVVDPGNADAYHLRGLAYMAQEDWPRAEQSLLRARQLKPNDPDILQNYGWLRCQRKEYEEADALFEQALAMPRYLSRVKTLLTQGLCQERAGQLKRAQDTLLKAYEFDAGNPIIGYHLASVIFAQGDAQRARFYIRRVNNGQFSDAASLWLGIKVERALHDTLAQGQLSEQLHKRYPDSKEALALERGAFDE